MFSHPVYLFLRKFSLQDSRGGSPGYLRLVFNGYKKASFVLAKKLEQCTSGAITKSDLRPDIYPKD
ncbi:helix-turn-helix domain-containing protein [Escherichia coli]|nr:helix-turn-helix domain-containing protein [Escherichia coli]USX43883.1 helix-turn-helix domain-containing protein [Escherichia coli]